MSLAILHAHFELILIRVTSGTVQPFERDLWSIVARAPLGECLAPSLAHGREITAEDVDQALLDP
jgi:hypothetical protein